MPLSHDPEGYRTPRPATNTISGKKLANEAAEAPGHFDIYRDRRVRLTSVLFSSSDWHWRLLSPTGEVLAVSEGYHSEAECRASIDAVRNHAAGATVTRSVG